MKSDLTRNGFMKNEYTSTCNRAWAHPVYRRYRHRPWGTYKLEILGDCCLETDVIKNPHPITLQYRTVIGSETISDKEVIESYKIVRAINPLKILIEGEESEMDDVVENYKNAKGFFRPDDVAAKRLGDPNVEAAIKAFRGDSDVSDVPDDLSDIDIGEDRIREFRLVFDEEKEYESQGSDNSVPDKKGMRKPRDKTKKLKDTLYSVRINMACLTGRMCEALKKLGAPMYVIIEHPRAIDYAGVNLALLFRGVWSNVQSLKYDGKGYTVCHHYILRYHYIFSHTDEFLDNNMSALRNKKDPYPNRHLSSLRRFENNYGLWDAQFQSLKIRGNRRVVPRILEWNDEFGIFGTMRISIDNVEEEIYLWKVLSALIGASTRRMADIGIGFRNVQFSFLSVNARDIVEGMFNLLRKEVTEEPVEESKYVSGIQILFGSPIRSEVWNGYAYPLEDIIVDGVLFTGMNLRSPTSNTVTLYAAMCRELSIIHSAVSFKVANGIREGLKGIRGTIVSTKSGNEALVRHVKTLTFNLDVNVQVNGKGKKMVPLIFSGKLLRFELFAVQSVGGVTLRALSGRGGIPVDDAADVIPERLYAVCVNTTLLLMSKSQKAFVEKRVGKDNPFPLDMGPVNQMIENMIFSEAQLLVISISDNTKQIVDFTLPTGATRRPIGTKAKDIIQNQKLISPLIYRESDGSITDTSFLVKLDEKGSCVVTSESLKHNVRKEIVILFIKGAMEVDLHMSPSLKPDVFLDEVGIVKSITSITQVKRKMGEVKT